MQNIIKQTNIKSSNSKPYDLEERTFLFAKNVRVFVKMLAKTTANIEDSRQLIRSSGSIGANYIESNESLGKKDFLMKLRISRKEAKETRFWLRLIDSENNDSLEKIKQELIQEASELLLIFSTIINKSEN